MTIFISPKQLWLSVTTLVCCIGMMVDSGPLLAQTQTTESASSGEISRAQFSSLVTDREPVDTLTSTSTDISRLYFFTEVNNMTGKVITHRWRYFEEVVAEIKFPINGPRWRVNSYKNLQTSMAGEWSVELVDDKGNNYGEHAILVTEGNGSQQTTGGQKSPVIEQIKLLFPDSDYALVAESKDNDICPPGGSFKWQPQANQLWALNTGSQPHIRVHATSDNSPTLRLDPDFTLTDSSCQMYSGHTFDSESAELVTQLQTDCKDDSNDIFSARSLRRHDEFVDLTIYDEQIAVCRYRIN